MSLLVLFIWSLDMEPNIRIRFTKDIFDAACGDHPTLILAKFNETGIILREISNTAYRYIVKTDLYDGEFGINEGEFEVIKDEDVKST